MEELAAMPRGGYHGDAATKIEIPPKNEKEAKRKGWSRMDRIQSFLEVRGSKPSSCFLIFACARLTSWQCVRSLYCLLSLFRIILTPPPSTMDWTSIYVESGEEDLLIPHLLQEHPTAPRLSLLVSHLYHEHHDDDDQVTHEHHRLFQLLQEGHPTSSYTLQALYYLCINFILGVGCLAVPFAFARAGFLLCSAILLTVTVLSYMTVLWVAESGARLEVLSNQVSSQEVPQSESSEGTALVPKPTATTTTASSDRPDINVEQYEVIDLVSYYLGHIHKVLYQVSLMALMYVGLLAYTQVFCGSIATLLWGPGGHTNSVGILGLPQVVFGSMVVPLSCCDLDEQVAIQSLMASVRFVALFIMIGGSTMALMLDGSHSNRTHPPYFAPAVPLDCQMSYTACFSGFGVAFSTALFSQLFQHSVPGLLRPLRDQPSKIKQAPVRRVLCFCFRCC